MGTERRLPEYRGMILVGVGGNGSVVSLVLTGADCQLAKELEPLDAIHLAHRLMQEALAITRHHLDTNRRDCSSDRVELTKSERVMLRMWRLQAGIMSKQMATDIGVSRQRFSNYETGARSVPYQVLEAWRQALGRE